MPSPPYATLNKQRLAAISAVDVGAARCLKQAMEDETIRSAFVAHSSDKEWSILVVSDSEFCVPEQRAGLKQTLAQRYGLRVPPERIAIVSSSSDRSEVFRPARAPIDRSERAHALVNVCFASRSTPIVGEPEYQG